MENIKRLWKSFMVVFLICFVVFNLNKTLIFSNHKVIWQKFSDLFEPLQKPFLNISGISIIKENKLEISKLNVFAPIIFNKKNSNKEEIKQQLKKGVLLYSDVLPGEKGKAIILGHSTPPGLSAINYTNIFSDLNQLEKGDEIIVYYNQKKYIYEVFDKRIFLPKDEEQVLLIKDRNQSILILLTCWPPGKDYKRLGILTKLK